MNQERGPREVDTKGRKRRYSVKRGLGDAGRHH